MFSGLQSRKPDVTLDVAVNIRPRLRWFQTQNITFTICAHQTSTLGNGDESPGGQAARRATAVSTRPFFFATKAVDVPREGGDVMKTTESLD